MGYLMGYLMGYIGNVIIPTDELIFFRGMAQPPTSYDVPYIGNKVNNWRTHIFQVQTTNQYTTEVSDLLVIFL